MGRPKTGSKKPPEPSGGGDERVVIMHLKGTPEYAAWLEAVYQKTHVPKTMMFRLAMQAWAKANGHPDPPDL